MRDVAFRQAQRDGLRDPHVAPINALVDELTAGARAEAGHRGWVPHVAPLHGGVDTRLLYVLRDPGPRVVDPDRPGAGFLCVENDNGSAARLRELFDRAEVPPGETTPWNACPWVLDRPPTAADVRAGVGPLRRLLGLLPHLEVVLLLGREAQRCWDLLVADDVDVAARDLHVLRARHVSVQAFIDPPVQRERWVGALGEPTRFNGRPVRCRPCRELTDASVATTSPHCFSESEADAYLLLTMCGKVRLGNMVDPKYTIGASIAKTYIG